MTDASRGTKPGQTPWAWQHKEALRLIARSFGESGNVATARSVYVALSEIASDAQEGTFSRGIDFIALKAAVSVRTTGGILQALEAIGLLKIERRQHHVSGLKAQSNYTLMMPPIGNGCLSVAPFGNGLQQPSVAEHIEESEEESEKKIGKNPSDTGKGFGGGTGEGEDFRQFVEGLATVLGDEMAYEETRWLSSYRHRPSSVLAAVNEVVAQIREGRFKVETTRSRYLMGVAKAMGYEPKTAADRPAA